MGNPLLDPDRSPSDGRKLVASYITALAAEQQPLDQLVREMTSQQNKAIEAACAAADAHEPPCGVLVIEHEDASISVFTSPGVPRREIWRGPESAFDFTVAP